MTPVEKLPWPHYGKPKGPIDGTPMKTSKTEPPMSDRCQLNFVTIAEQHPPKHAKQREQLLTNVILLAEIQKGDVIGEGDERRIGQLLAFVRAKLDEADLDELQNYRSPLALKVKRAERWLKCDNCGRGEDAPFAPGDTCLCGGTYKLAELGDDGKVIEVPWLISQGWEYHDGDSQPWCNKVIGGIPMSYYLCSHELCIAGYHTYQKFLTRRDLKNLCAALGIELKD